MKVPFSPGATGGLRVSANISIEAYEVASDDATRVNEQPKRKLEALSLGD